MARITTVASARKRKAGNDPHTCYACGEDIVEGTAYSWAQPSRYSVRINWHATCPQPPASRLESNDKRAAAMASFEDGYEAIEALRTQQTDSDVEFDTDAFVTEIRDVLSAIAESVREAGELWREAASNIEDGFGHPTTMSEEFEGFADEVDGVADEIESIDPEEYDESQWTDLDEWISSTIDNVIDELGGAEGNLP